MYNAYLRDNSAAEWLSKIAHTSDFFTKDMEIPPLPELIIFYKTFPDFYHRVSELAKKTLKRNAMGYGNAKRLPQVLKVKRQSKRDHL
jgi:hypothetical protein